MSDGHLLTRLNAIVAAAGGQVPACPSRMLDGWSAFVTECEGGYVSTIYEFENDRAVRDVIGAVLDDPQLAREPELEYFRGVVRDLDQRFRAVCRTDVQIGKDGDPWWRRCVPANAAGDLADDLSRLYGIEPR